MVHQFARPFNPEGVLAYLITFRCYGTWLHGDTRGSMDRAGHNVYGEPRMPGDKQREARERGCLAQVPMQLSLVMRHVVDEAIREVCIHRDWVLYALNVQVDHVHLVIAAGGLPEMMMTTFKSYATRRLREAGHVDSAARVWSRHGSTKYLWVETQIDHAIAYVVDNQPLPPGM